MQQLLMKEWDELCHPGDRLPCLCPSSSGESRARTDPDAVRCASDTSSIPTVNVRSGTSLQKSTSPAGSHPLVATP